VAERLLELEAVVSLLVSSKEVDQRVLRNESRFNVISLPAVALTGSRRFKAFTHAVRSFRMARCAFRRHPPSVFLSMGGFTGTPPALAARSMGVPVVLHEANAIPGRANRWLARWARRAYVYFPQAGEALARCEVRTLGMPVREQFQELDAGACRMALGLSAAHPVLLVMGGSQGAHAINELVLQTIGDLAPRVPGLQVIHLTGTEQIAKAQATYRAARVSALIRPFLTEMELALGAADAAVARAGASSLAELAAMRVPTLLIPYPHAADDHQMANATAFERSEAAWVLPQSEATPTRLCGDLVSLLLDREVQARLRSGLTRWHRPDRDTALARELLQIAQTGGPHAAPARPTAGDSARSFSVA
jgi:UDP-N-acetylglucosamine--N-acetylmuramyl-(pentapeptide) pyrophosphoryl-undecaprenol N-acetylglucosamine transferase